MVRNTLEVHHSIKQFDLVQLTQGGERIRDLPNAGGNSVASEVMSFEILRCLHGAELVFTEMELEYFPHGGKITDFSIALYSLHLGVSVTRAMKYGGIFDRSDGRKLLEKKMQGVIDSSKLVMQPFHKQILHIFAEKEYVADVLEDVYAELSNELRSNTLLVVTVVNNAEWIFRNEKNKNKNKKVEAGTGQKE